MGFELIHETNMEFLRLTILFTQYYVNLLHFQCAVTFYEHDILSSNWISSLEIRADREIYNLYENGFKRKIFEVCRLQL